MELGARKVGDLCRGVLALTILAALSCAARGQCVTQWRPVPGAPGTQGITRALHWWDPDGAGPNEPLLVVGGEFDLAAGSSPAGVVAWEPARGAWQVLGAGGTLSTLSLAVGLNGQLVAGTWGDVMRRDSEAWSSMGLSPFGLAVWAVATLPAGELVCGGASGFSVNGGVYRWTGGTSWVPVGAPPRGRVYALLSLPNGDLVAGGELGAVGGVPTLGIGRWNGASWSAFDHGVNAEVWALEALPNGDIVAGGNFTGASGMLASGIARWNGTSWSALGAGVHGEVWCLAVFPNGDLVAGGQFDAAGGIPARNIARWDGSSWSALGDGVPGIVYAVSAMPNGDVLAGGNSGLNGQVGMVYLWRYSTYCPCPADLDDGSGFGSASGARDEAVTIDDLLFFVAAYGASDLRADLDDGSGAGTPDGGVDINDLLYFLAHYEAGC